MGKRLILIIALISICSIKNIYGQNEKFDSLYIELERTGQDTNRVKLLLKIGDHFLYNNPDTSRYYCNQGFQISKTLEEKKFESSCLNTIGISYAIQGSYEKATETLLKVLKIYEELKDKNGMSQCYTNIGLIHSYQGSYDKAMEYYLKSLKIDEELGDKKGISDCYTNIGSVYYDQCRYDNAIEYYLKALKIYEDLGDKNGMSNCYNNIGAIHADQGNYEKATDNFLKSLKISVELQDKNGIANVYGNIAGLHIMLADSAQHQGLGGRSTHLDSALQYGNMAYELALDVGAVPMQNDAAAILQKVYTKLGRFKEAIKYAEIFITTQDSMFS